MNNHNQNIEQELVSKMNDYEKRCHIKNFNDNRQFNELDILDLSLLLQFVGKKIFKIK